MGSLECRNDALHAADRPKRIQRFGIGGGLVRDATAVAQEAVLRPDARIVEARGDRMSRRDLAVGILEQIAQAAVQHSGCTGAERGAVVTGADPFTRRFDSDEPYVGIVEKAGEDAHRIRAATNAGHHGMRKPPVAGQHLAPRFASDDRLKIPNHAWIGVRTHHGADDVVRGR